VKLLFDQNISYRIVQRIQDLFPESQQVRNLGLEDKSDREIWEYAKSQDFTIVTFDMDFYDFSIVWGSPPKILWLRITDQRNEQIEHILRNRHEIIVDFLVQEDLDCLELS